VTRYDVYRTFHKYKYSFKNKSLKNKLKFTLQNVIWYGIYCDMILRVPLRFLKYLDEAHFSSRDLRVNKGWAPCGQRLMGSNDDSLSENFSVTLMTGLHDASSPHGPVLLDVRTDTNTSLDFCKFIVAAVTEGFLGAGDVLVCDNASVHKSPFLTLELNAWLEERMITIVYLPTYSPELNPCEMVFGYVKNSLRRTRNSNNPFLNEIVERFLSLPRDMLERFYDHCLREGAV